MYRKGKILLPILIVLTAISLLTAVGVFYLYQKESAQNVKLQEQIVSLEDLQRKTVSKLDETKKIVTDLELKLQEAKGKIDSLSSELAMEKSAHVETTSKLAQKQADLNKQKFVRKNLEGQLSKVQDESKLVKEEIKNMQRQKIMLEEKIKNLENGVGGVELGKVVVNPEISANNNALPRQFKITNKKTKAQGAKEEKTVKKEPPLLVKGLEGKVMIVNKEFNFVVINLGSKDKINVGDEFSVSRGGKPIGDLKVEKVHEAMSAAGFAVGLKDLIKENDLVTQKIK